jgi:two-component system chemotaxis response regulator CheY
MSIFIVDDDLSVLETYNKFFEVLGYEILGNATNGEEAIIKFQKFIQKPDFIIMDYHMPYKNGVEAIKEILKIEKSAKIIIISGDPSVKEQAITSGAICFKEKPFNMLKFIQQINIYRKRREIRLKC